MPTVGRSGDNRTPAAIVPSDFAAVAGHGTLIIEKRSPMIADPSTRKRRSLRRFRRLPALPRRQMFTHIDHQIVMRPLPVVVAKHHKGGGCFLAIPKAPF